MTSVFISYAHADKDLKERFVVHLSALKRQRLIDVWHDGMLIPGEHLDSAIEAQLAAADLVILLVSADFIYSDYCFQKEMQRAFARAKHGHCKVVAVLLKPCDWRELPIDEDSQLGDFVALPKDGKPVAQWPHEEGLHSAVEGIKRLITGPVPRPPKRDDSSPTRRAAKEMFVRDVWLTDAIWRVFLGTWNLPPYVDRAPEGKSENQRLYDLVTDEFRQAAFDGYLPIWAKRSNSSLWEVVPPEFWKDCQISYLTAHREEPTKLSAETWSPSRAAQQTNEWREFMTSKMAVDGYQWPPVPSGYSERRSSAPPVPRPSSQIGEHVLAACPICKTPAELLPKLGDAEGFQCPVHERFRVSGTVLEIPALRNASERKWEKAWKRAKARQSDMIAMIRSGDFA
jgi:hypothetical protein